MEQRRKRPNSREWRCRRFRVALGIVFVGSIFTGNIAAVLCPSSWAQPPAPPAIPDPPPTLPPLVVTDRGDSVKELLWARPFVLTEPYPNYYSAESGDSVQRGWLLVLEVDPELARMRAIDMPTLFVDSSAVERTNDGSGSGRIVVIVPDATPATVPEQKPSSTEAPPSLVGARVYFGSVALPESIDRKRGEQELAAANKLGIAPLTASQVAHACRQGGGLAEGSEGSGGSQIAKTQDAEPLRLTNSRALQREVGSLILRYAPDEQELAKSYLRLPPAQKPNK